jgi:hypothetical protein
MHDLDAFDLTDPQEPNHIDINECYFLQVQDTPRSWRMELLLQHANVLGLKASNKADRCSSALRVPFDLQCPLCLIEACMEHDCNTVAIAIY